jgi:hypothetical protein
MAPRKALATQAARKSAPATGGVKKPTGGNRKDITSSDSDQFSRESSRRSSRDVSPVQDAASATVVWLVPRIPGLSSPSTRISNIFLQVTGDSEEEGVGAAVVCKQVASPNVVHPKKSSKRQRKEEDVVVYKQVESPNVVNPKKLPKRHRKKKDSVVCKQGDSPNVIHPKKLPKRHRKEEDVVICKQVESPHVVPKKLHKRKRKERESKEDERNVQYGTVFDWKKFGFK